MIEVTDFHRAVARHFADAIGIADPLFRRYASDLGKGEIHMLSADDTPDPGVRTFSTVGLSAHPMRRNGAEFPVRLEMYGASYAHCADIYGRVLSSAAFEVMTAGWICLPNVIFPGLFSLYPGASETMSDIFFADPYGWAERLKSFKVEGHTVAWLMAVPISRNEADFAREHGAARFVEHLEMAGIDVFDLNRRSTV